MIELSHNVTIVLGVLKAVLMLWIMEGNSKSNKIVRCYHEAYKWTEVPLKKQIVEIID